MNKKGKIGKDLLKKLILALVSVGVLVLLDVLKLKSLPFLFLRLACFGVMIWILYSLSSHGE
jgi:hypothetical protein